MNHRTRGVFCYCICFKVDYCVSGTSVIVVNAVAVDCIAGIFVDVDYVIDVAVHCVVVDVALAVVVVAVRVWKEGRTDVIQYRQHAVWMNELDDCV